MKNNHPICNAPVVANPVEIHGTWETVHNPDVNSGKFAIINREGLSRNSFRIPRFSQQGRNESRPATIWKFRIVRFDGVREVTRAVEHYNPAPD